MCIACQEIHYKNCYRVISNKEFQKLIYMMQRYHAVMSKFTEIVVDLLSKIIKYSRASKNAGEKIPA